MMGVCQFPRVGKTSDNALLETIGNPAAGAAGAALDLGAENLFRAR
jgi:hypothetical protein